MIDSKSLGLSPSSAREIVSGGHRLFRERSRGGKGRTAKTGQQKLLPFQVKGTASFGRTHIAKFERLRASKKSFTSGVNNNKHGSEDL